MQNNDPDDMGRKGGATPTTTASSVRAYDRPAQANPIAKLLPFIIGALVLGMLFALASRFRNNGNDANNNATQSAPAGNNRTMNSSGDSGMNRSSQPPGPHSNAPTAGGNTMGSGSTGTMGSGGAGATSSPPGPTAR